MEYTPEQLKADLEALKKSMGEQTQAEIQKSIAALEAKIPASNNEEVTALKSELATMKADFNTLQARVKDVKATPMVQKSYEQQIFDAVIEKTDEIARLSEKKGFKHVIDIPITKSAGDITTANVTGGSVYGAIYQNGITELPKRKVHMRQVIPTGSIGAGTDYYFMKQNGNGEGSVAPTAENATKPQTDEDLIESSVKIETIAGWERITRKALRNVPGMISFLQSRLLEKLYKAEDAQILYGDGNSPNLKGILTSGNYTANASSAGSFIEQIIDGLSVLDDSNEVNASVIVCRPAEYYGLFKNKATGSGEFDLPFNITFVNNQLYISGIPVVPSTALNAGDWFIMDAMGAQFLQQESVRIEFFDQDGTNVRENKTTIRIEETVALPVYGSIYTLGNVN